MKARDEPRFCHWAALETATELPVYPDAFIAVYNDDAFKANILPACSTY
jgi:hypothetical protein